mgnify:CR=1 FL=1
MSQHNVLLSGVMAVRLSFHVFLLYSIPGMIKLTDLFISWIDYIWSFYLAYTKYGK